MIFNFRLGFSKVLYEGMHVSDRNWKAVFFLCLPPRKLYSSLWFSGDFDRLWEMFSFSSFCYSCLLLYSILYFFSFIMFFPYFRKLFLLFFLIHYIKIQWSSLFIFFPSSIMFLSPGRSIWRKKILLSPQSQD